MSKDIQTSAFNVYPQQQVNPKDPSATETKTTYVVENTVNVTVRDLSKLGGLLDKVVGSGANTIHGIQFDVKDKAKALSEARKQAIDDAKAQAAEVAQAAGVQLGAIQTLNVYTGGQPGPVYQGKGGFAVAADSQCASFRRSAPDHRRRQHHLRNQVRNLSFAGCLTTLWSNSLQIFIKKVSFQRHSPLKTDFLIARCKGKMMVEIHHHYA